MDDRNYYGLHFANMIIAFVAFVLAIMIPETRESFAIYFLFLTVILLSGIYTELSRLANSERKPQRRRY